MRTMQQNNTIDPVDLIAQTLWLGVVAALWGGTNPLMKKAGAGIEKIQETNCISQFFGELQFLISNWKYMVTFLLNQSGSVLYYLALANSDISLVVPITNSLTFIFTLLSGYLLKENIGSKNTYIGVGLVVVGVSLCVVAKLKV